MLISVVRKYAPKKIIIYKKYDILQMKNLLSATEYCNRAHSILFREIKCLCF